MLAAEEYGVGCSEEWKQAVLLLAIVEDLKFGVFAGAVGVVALATYGRVADGDGACHGECFVGTVDDVGPYLHHGDVSVDGYGR